MQAVRRKLTGTIPRLPWIPFSANRALDARLSKSSRVWEVGAGYSTLWLADRVGKLTSIEASEEWYQRLSRIIAGEGLKNVDLRHVWAADAMSNFDELADGELDLLFIDGGPRDVCLKNGWRKVRKNGMLYLDNWENAEFWNDARDWVARNRNLFSREEYFVDYVPAQVGVYEGAILTLA
jgi:predicted O-methyltransferase YrrM